MGTFVGERYACAAGCRAACGRGQNNRKIGEMECDAENLKLAENLAMARGLGNVDTNYDCITCSGFYRLFELLTKFPNVSSRASETGSHFSTAAWRLDNHIAARL